MTGGLRRDGRTVLVVDDDGINRTMLTKLLEHEGYRPATAANGREALAALESEQFDAVLLDIVMPEVDGMEVLRRLKQDARLWHLPVIMISAVDEVDSIVACLELGAEDYVQKPFDPVLLRARLNSCLARRRFHTLEVEYQRMVEEQAAELEGLRRDLGSAGTAAGPAPAVTAAAPRRAPAAVLAARLAGAAGLADAADPAAVAEVLAAFAAAVDAAARQSGGTVAGRGADAATAVFEGPDAARTALRAATVLGDDLRSRLAGWNDRHGAALAVAAGVGAGDVALCPATDGSGGAPAVAGSAVDRARSLAGLPAAAGAVVLDAAAFAETGSPGGAEPLAAGGAGDVPAYRLVPPPGGPPASG